MSFSQIRFPATLIPMPEADDEDHSATLLQKVGGGDVAAFNSIVARWKNPLINFFRRSTFSSEDAEDLAIATLTKVYFSAANYRPTASFPAYLFTIARRQLISFHRRSQARPSVILQDHLDETASIGIDRCQETEEWLENGLRHLPERGRTALLLYAQQGLSYQEIAHSLGQSLSATKVQIHRARQSLKAILESSQP